MTMKVALGGLAVLTAVYVYYGHTLMVTPATASLPDTQRDWHQIPRPEARHE